MPFIYLNERPFVRGGKEEFATPGVFTAPQRGQPQIGQPPDQQTQSFLQLFLSRMLANAISIFTHTLDMMEAKKVLYKILTWRRKR